MNVDPSALPALGVFVVYLAVVSVIWRVNAVDYETLADSRTNIVRGIVVPIGVAGALTATATTAFGWWGPVWFEESLSAPAWTWLVPILLTLVVLINISTIRWRSPRASVLPLLAVGTALVGFSEELLTRGVLIVGLRGDFTEVWVWIGSCLLFGILHGINALFGQSTRQTVTQVAFAFGMGSAFYATRAVTGSILIGIVLHAIWDFGTLGTPTTEGTRSTVGAILAILTLVAGFVAALVIAT